ncbi:MAG: hypothetical protein LBM08_10220 [Dysgonamonadaceae bacterium]|jgi:hypothetical protein|nr:hypothetical protein [Dysgonamonadaceae bacterium]
MRLSVSIAFALFIGILLPVQAQISHGGTPLFLPDFPTSDPSLLSLRHATVNNALDDALNDYFIEMPTFDLNEMLE